MAAALTTNDSAVLQALFDAESSPSSATTIDPALPPFPANTDITPEVHDSLHIREQAIINSLQSQEDISRPTIQSAIEALTALITEYPGYASAYVNRAQAFRLLAGDNSIHGDQDKSLLTERLLADLGRAVTLCTPASSSSSSSSPTAAVSTVQARVLADAHTHRGYLLLQAARAKSRDDEKEEDEGGFVTGKSGSELEELASRDFFLGGRYGNKIAQQLAVQTNPYAKMCGAIVKEAMREEVSLG